MRFNKIDSFNFENQIVKLERFKKFRITNEFKDACLPLIVPHLRPLEVVIAAMINGWADRDMALTDTVIYSEREINSAMLPLFKIMLRYYFPDNTYNDDRLDTIMPSLEDIYAAIYSQIEIEGIFEFYLRRKFTFVEDLAKFLNLEVDFSQYASKIEAAVKRVTKKDPDKDFSRVEDAK